MAEKRDYYEVLEVTKEATVEEIKKAGKKPSNITRTKIRVIRKQKKSLKKQPKRMTY